MVHGARSCADQNVPVLRRRSSDNAAPHGDNAKNSASKCKSASPELSTHGSRIVNDTTSTNTASAARRLCQPTVKATAASSSAAHPISRAWSLVQISKTPHWNATGGWGGMTPYSPNRSYRSGSSDTVQATINAPNTILIRPSV